MDRVGFTVLTVDGQVGTGPVAVYGLNLTSGGGASVVALRNGTSTAGTIVIQEKGTTGQGVSFDYMNGIVFPSGCFCDVDANISSVAVFYKTLT